MVIVGSGCFAEIEVDIETSAWEAGGIGTPSQVYSILNVKIKSSVIFFLWSQKNRFLRIF